MKAGALILILFAGVVALRAAPQPPVLAQQRREQIEASLPEAPRGWGAPASDRESWNRAAATLPVRELLEAATESLAEKPLVIPDELYLRYSRDGNRMEFQNANVRRLRRMNQFAWAEAIEGRGRFAAALRREIEAILAEKTWVQPAHDPTLNNFKGLWTEVDLMVAMKGWSVATAAYWHAETLGPELMGRVRSELKRRVIAPFLARMRGEKSGETGGMWWSAVDHNWNSVCHAGVVGVALATLESRAARAEVIGYAELNLQNYLRGFTPDGYCSEGISYWNYGFGHFAMLSETLGRATRGVVRPLSGDHTRRVAAYPWALQIVPGVFPAFADMALGERPSSWFGALAVMQDHPESLGMKSGEISADDLRTLMLYDSAMKVFLPLLTEGRPAASAPSVSGPRHWFPDAQVYTGRASADFGAAIKGGHNDEHHNHNDLGSFVIARADRAGLVDPGSEVYTKRTFSADRYASKVLSSYGHSVPVVAGDLQKVGRDYAATVLSRSFSEAEDVVVLDLTRGYAVPTLKSLVRTFTLRRGSEPSIEIRDDVEFAAPSSFSSALITFEKFQWKDDLITVGEGNSALRVHVACTAPWTLQAKVLDEDLPGKKKPTRLGLMLGEPVTRATLTVTVRPD